MLSQENIDKLHMNGLYRCEPVRSWLPSYKRDNPYWCKNWTFKVHKGGNNYYMYDTYWSTGDEYPVELTDENFDKFELLFDLDNIRIVKSFEDWLEYPDDKKWNVALDSGGWNYAKYVIIRGTEKIKKRVVVRMQHEINYLKQELAHKERILEGVLSGEIDYNLW